jgi:hypothetical protein
MERQFEASATYATSYIPTLGASVTRGADDASKAGISSLIGQTEGTIFLEVDKTSRSDNDYRIQISDGTTNNWLFIGVEVGNNIRLYCNVGGVNQFSVYGSVVTSGIHKVAMAYKANDFKVYVDGVAWITQTSGSVPACSKLNLGSAAPTTDASTDSKTSQAILFKTRLTNAQLAELDHPMSYYDDSSLFVAPNGYKTSVLFAQKPMDANGQLAFTRSNDTATRVGPDGLIQRVRTNLILQSNTFSNASWTNNTLVTANNQISPDGTLDASTFTSDGAYHGVLQSLTITSVPHTFSIYAKAGNYSIFRIVNVSSLTNVAWFNLSTGVTSGAIGGTSKIEAVGNGWFRCSYSTNSPNTSTTNQGFVLSDAMGSLGGVPSGSTMYFWKSQVETGTSQQTTSQQPLPQ